MRKRIIKTQVQPVAQTSRWLNLQQIATAEITSEDDLFPIEHALSNTVSTGWRAANAGPQTIRLVFDEPHELHRIHIHIIDRAAERTQEMTLSVEMAGVGQQEVWRQQFNFSPSGTTEELEDISIELRNVTVVELRIDPDRAHDPAHSQNYATLTSLRLG